MQLREVDSLDLDELSEIFCLILHQEVIMKLTPITLEVGYLSSTSFHRL